jgi:hypothetical protein
MTPTLLDFVGPGLSLVGLFLTFFFGMPFRMQGNVVVVDYDALTPREKALDALYKFVGGIGFLLTAVGILFPLMLPYIR